MALRGNPDGRPSPHRLQPAAQCRQGHPESILKAGGEIHFNARVEHLLRSADGRRVRGVACADGREFEANAVLLATGHSARDVYRMLLADGLVLEQKPLCRGRTH